MGEVADERWERGGRREMGERWKTRDGREVADEMGEVADEMGEVADERWERGGRREMGEVEDKRWERGGRREMGERWKTRDGRERWKTRDGRERWKTRDGREELRGKRKIINIHQEGKHTYTETA
ncbi:hypothetical protein Pcinc_036189 [Petrolisthes cinctipes]|uniref:Uncharacterized protein n=1 Tax=Petrolisthes cinctipes TaxID=88211 RepID=A0AAE1EPM0_PETCI|nr:hypothetical protein Pcinc_036189 [Petrolisthes cinctipes]